MRGFPLLAAALACLTPHIALSQPVPGDGTNTRSGEVIDILVPVLTPEEQAEREACERAKAEAAEQGEILVCAEPVDSSEFFYSGNAEAAEDRYARETMNKGNPQTPDPCGPNCGIFTGVPTVSGLCGFLFNPCPPPPALIIDVTALPQAPAGSDAERVGMGLEPLGNDDSEELDRAMSEFEKKELGLPPVPDFKREEDGGEAARVDPD
jgi:hypothetical protein